MILGDILSINARKYPSRIALVYGDSKLTYGEINARVNRLTNALRALGVKHGDRIAMRAKNCTQFVEFFFAAAKCGAIAVPVNPLLKDREFSYMIGDSGAQVLFIQEADIPFCQALNAPSLGIRHIICVDGGAGEIKDYETLLAESNPEEPSIEVEDNEPAMIVYTSGTTGPPKGVTLSHRNCFADVNHILIEQLVEPHHIVLLPFPLFHTAAISGLLKVFYVAARLVLTTGTNPSDLIKTIEREKITSLNIVPTLLSAMCNAPEIKTCDISSVILVGYGGASMPMEQIKKAAAIFKCGFFQALGTTETAPCITSFTAEAHREALENENKNQRLASCGRPMVGVETRVVDTRDRDVPVGQIGELCVRGENVMLGYWNKPEETAAAIRNGWYHTGDLVRQDEDNYIYIVDRIKDVIISGGENISSREVEEIIYMHPHVLEASVIGVPDPHWGEAIVAVVVPQQGTKIEAKEIIDLCKAKLAPFKKPKSVVFAEALPKNPTGKILKTELRKLYGQKAA